MVFVLKIQKKLQVLARVFLALFFGGLGGFVANELLIPMPWMLGAMVANTAAVMFTIPVLPPASMRPYVMAIIGVMLGSSFTPSLINEIYLWSLSLCLLAIYIIIACSLIIPYYKYFGKFDTVSAYFAGMPGGFSELMLIGEEYGGDLKKIALAHTGRIFVVVFLISLWFKIFDDVELVNRSEFGISIQGFPVNEILILIACGAIGYFVARKLRIPAPGLMGPMLVSALAHITQLATLPPPRELVMLAQLFLGTIIGCRFLGATAMEIGKALFLSLGATAILLTLTAVFTIGLSEEAMKHYDKILLAFSPGGLPEMSLIALALESDVPFVAMHHMIRIILIVALAPFILRFFLSR